MSEAAAAEKHPPAARGAAAPPGQHFTIHDLVEEFGLTARTLRFYEEKGLLAPARRGQDRLYSRRDRARLKLVLMGKSVGFSLEEVRDMLDLYDLGDGQETQLRVALARFEEKLGELEARRRDIDRALAELSHARDLVRARLARRAGGTD
jgi:DNA-binding transcriptional MerR regulator